jgi:hypothetical protein
MMSTQTPFYWGKGAGQEAEHHIHLVLRLILNGALLPLTHVPLFHCCVLPYYSYMYEGTVIITVHEYKLLDYSSSNSPCRMVDVSTTGSAVCGE